MEEYSYTNRWYIYKYVYCLPNQLDMAIKFNKLFMKYHTCETPDEVCEWCNPHQGYTIISITYRYSNLYDEDCLYVIFYEDFSNQQPKRIAAHNIDPGIAIQAADALLQTVRYPSYVYSNKRPEDSEPIC